MSRRNRFAKRKQIITSVTAAKPPTVAGATPAETFLLTINAGGDYLLINASSDRLKWKT